MNVIRCIVIVVLMFSLMACKVFAQTNENMDVNAYHGEETALIQAIWSGNINKIKSLLDKGADPNLLRRGGDNIIVPISMSAVNSGLTHQQVAEIVKLLIDHGAKLELKDNTYGYTPLMWMIEYNQPEAVKVLLDAGASVDARNNHDDTPLSMASKEGRLEIVKILSQSKHSGAAYLDKSLCNAVWQKRVDVVRELLPQMKKIPSCALDLAVIRGPIDVVSMLLDAGADPNLIDRVDTPLITAIKEENEQIVSLLLRNKADPQLQTKNQWSPLTQAAYVGNLNIIKMLINLKIDVDKKAGNDTAFQVAIRQNHKEAAMMILDAGADVVDNFTGNGKILPLAAEKGYEDIVKAMIEKGCLIDSRGDAITQSGATALMLAADKGYLNMVKFLVEHGADLKMKSQNFEGNDFAQVFIGNALDWAQKGGHQDVIEYLISKGAISSIKPQ